MMSLGLVFLFPLLYTQHQMLKLLRSSLAREGFAFFSALGFSKWPCGILESQNFTFQQFLKELPCG